jgi:hypothetical protein
MRKWILIVLSMFVLSNAVGCKMVQQFLGKKAKEEMSKDESSDDKSSKSDKKGKSKKSGSDDDKPAAAKVNYFEDATSLAKLYKAKVGGETRVLEMLIYPEYGHAQIVDPKKPDQGDQYDIRNDVVEDPGPLKFTGKQPTKEDLKFSSFDIDEVDYTAVPKIVKDAIVQLKYEDAKTTHIMLKRPLPFNKDIRFRVYVNSPRRSGSVEYDAKGKMLKVYE